MNIEIADIPETWWKEDNLLGIIQWNKISNNDNKMNSDNLPGSNDMHLRVLILLLKILLVLEVLGRYEGAF